MKASHKIVVREQLFRRSAFELKKLNAPDEVLADLATERVLRLIPRLAEKFDPQKGCFGSYVKGSLKKICAKLAHRYYREHGSLGIRPLESLPSPIPTPYQLAAIAEVKETVLSIAKLLRPTDRKVLLAAYPKLFGQSQTGKDSGTRAYTKISRAKARLHAKLLEQPISHPWQNLLLLLMPPRS